MQYFLEKDKVCEIFNKSLTQIGAKLERSSVDGKRLKNAQNFLLSFNF